MDTRAFRRSLNKSDNYYRNQGFGEKEQIATQMGDEYQSELIQTIRNQGYTYTQGDVTIKLAKDFGFCWGVERAIAMAYEARQHFPSQRIWITNEIIHNPGVNQRLQDMNVQFIQVINGTKDFSVVDQGDVVILPAFGASVDEMKLLNDRACTIIDTTCPWVSKVWTTVEKHKKSSFTSIIHGKYKHEETVATKSFADKYLVVLNLDEAQYVADYILRSGDSPEERLRQRNEFLAKFANAYSEGFDPDQDLTAVGIANQTTMLKGETERIGKLLERTMLKKYGPQAVNNHFSSFNTICDATQERQDAMFELVDMDMDLMVVIGGFNSSNTTHLQEIAIERGIPSYHIDGPQRLSSDNQIEHQPLHQAITVSQNWLPEGKIVIGITSGASTPDKSVAQVIQRIFQLKAELPTPAVV
ncbi:4-hydroxy-3-methylbut-2-enyl diphosphate reductase [Leptolyngbya sp. Heron Island J]|uniref:4-hydroxy-3-methylbut-2-enyl diphosphate reductase n=1 Tax=Leptolyngbya sp. Heron Island J TaxID=1385935 RepID=UPI0003B9E81C|nr:4-hydroxy-3-methylbut-2-enyl diphosphate reductase [Leptolyngbya sp. Heron Island J]ESA37632.1 4-hydroxy-3-methylbut-2-enyl diphosphate reductase [Leptolyngbya sp. Heron Island J]